MGTKHLVIVYYKGRYCIAQYGAWDGYPAKQGRDVLEFARDPELIAKLEAALDAGMVYEPTDEEIDVLNQKITDMQADIDEQFRIANEDKPPPSERILQGIMSDPWMKKMFEASVRARSTTQTQSGESDSDGAPPPFNPTREEKEEWAHRPITIQEAVYAAPQKAIEIICPSLSLGCSAQILALVAHATEPVPVRNRLDFITDELFCEWAYVLDLDARVLESWRSGFFRDGEEEQTLRFDYLEAIQSGEGGRPTMTASFALDDLPDERTFIEESGDIGEENPMPWGEADAANSGEFMWAPVYVL